MRRSSIFVILLLLLALAGAWSGCAPAPSGGTTGKPVIGVSIFPLASLTRQLVDDWADVVTLLPADASPHNVELNADQVRELNRANLLVVVGSGLDPWAEQAAAATRRSGLKIVRTADMAPDSARDPANNHLWLDPVITREFVARLAEQLEQQYPAHAEQIRQAAKSLDGDLKQLDDDYRRELSAAPEKNLITFHNAFDLTAQRYGLNIVVRLTDIEISPGGEVTPDRFREAVDAVRKYKLKTLYAEPEFPAEVIEALRRQTGARVLVLDPQGNPNVAGYRTYQEMMRSNLKNLVSGQSAAK